MPGKKVVKKYFFLKWLLTVMAIFFVLAASLAAAYWLYSKKYADRIYPGIYAGAHKLSGLTHEEAKNILNQKADMISKKGIVFSYDNHRASLFPLVASVEGDLAYRIFDFDIEKNVADAYGYGRGGNFIGNLNERLRALLSPQYIPIAYILNENEARRFVADNFSGFVAPARDAELVHNDGADLAKIKFIIETEKTGQVLDYEKTINELKNNLEQLSDAAVNIPVSVEYPKIYARDCLNIEAEAKKILALAPLSLEYGSDIWMINFSKLLSWLTLKPAGNEPGGVVTVGLDFKEAAEFLSASVAPGINQPAENAKFEIKNGRVVEFQASRDGLELNINESLIKLETELREHGNNKIELSVREAKSALQTEAINDLGIKEIIGIGHSVFAGSPVNRRHNIKTGAAALNGVLIKPDEEFSLIKTLGDIDKESGYLPELVIKENRTIPEYGGGLCQIGTTMFRATLATGLPITMRRNHSYRVSYYEPAGTDATIYNPWPDYRFLNDTGSHILIQARIEGDNLYFDFWGTKDGRRAEKTDPLITNIVKPAPAKLIETLDLKPGQKKCTESAHSGADASFNYTVTYADGRVENKTFKSHYVPWREVCLIGVEKLSETKESAATSSAEIIP